MSTFVFTFKFMLYSVCVHMLSLPVVVTMTNRLHLSNQPQRRLFEIMLVLMNNLVPNASLFYSLSIMTERWL